MIILQREKSDVPVSVSTLTLIYMDMSCMWWWIWFWCLVEHKDSQSSAQFPQEDTSDESLSLDKDGDLVLTRRKSHISKYELLLL